MERIEVPDGHLDKEQSISYKERDNLMHFNTEKYWDCFFDVKTKRLYNEYCRLLMEDGYDYLLNLGLIDKDMNQIKYFEV